MIPPKFLTNLLAALVALVAAIYSGSCISSGHGHIDTPDASVTPMQYGEGWRYDPVHRIFETVQGLRITVPDEWEITVDARLSPPWYAPRRSDVSFFRRSSGTAIHLLARARTNSASPIEPEAQVLPQSVPDVMAALGRFGLKRGHCETDGDIACYSAEADFDRMHLRLLIETPLTSEGVPPSLAVARAVLAATPTWIPLEERAGILADITLNRPASCVSGLAWSGSTFRDDMRGVRWTVPPDGFWRGRLAYREVINYIEPPGDSNDDDGVGYFEDLVTGVRVVLVATSSLTDLHTSYFEFLQGKGGTPVTVSGADAGYTTRELDDMNRVNQRELAVARGDILLKLRVFGPDAVVSRNENLVDSIFAGLYLGPKSESGCPE